MIARPNCRLAARIAASRSLGTCRPTIFQSAVWQRSWLTLPRANSMAKRYGSGRSISVADVPMSRPKPSICHGATR